MGVQIPHGKREFWGGRRPTVKYIGTLCGSRCTNGWNDRDTILVEDSGGPREPCIRFGSRPPMTMGNFWGRRAHCKYSDFLRWAVQERLNRSICRLDCGLEWAEENASSVVFARWRQCAQIGRHIRATWQIRLNRPSVAAMRSYVKLLWPLVDIATVKLNSLEDFLIPNAVAKWRMLWDYCCFVQGYNQ